LPIYQPAIKPKTINEDIITNIDFAPTLLDIANIKIPSEEKRETT
jgi:arylsulfatase A-like enzyme